MVKHDINLDQFDLGLFNLGPRSINLGIFNPDQFKIGPLNLGQVDSSQFNLRQTCQDQLNIGQHNLGQFIQDKPNASGLPKLYFHNLHGYIQFILGVGKQEVKPRKTTLKKEKQPFPNCIFLRGH